MQSFTFCIDDDRYALPVRLAVSLPNGTPVRKHAQSVLDQNHHYRGIEVFVAATSLFKVGGAADNEPQAS